MTAVRRPSLDVATAGSAAGLSGLPGGDGFRDVAVPLPFPAPAASARDQRLVDLAERDWPKRHDAACRGGLIVLQHRVSGALGRCSGTSGRWSCPGCGGEKAARAWFSITRQAPDPMWWAWVPFDEGVRERIKKRADRVKKQPGRDGKGARYFLVRRLSSIHVFSDADLSGRKAPSSGRFLSPAEVAIAARFALCPPSVRWVSAGGGFVLAKPVSAWRTLAYTSWGNAQTAQDRAEAELVALHGSPVDLSAELPPALMAEAGEVFLKHLAGVRGERREETDPWKPEVNEGEED